MTDVFSFIALAALAILLALSCLGSVLWVIGFVVQILTLVFSVPMLILGIVYLNFFGEYLIIFYFICLWVGVRFVASKFSRGPIGEFLVSRVLKKLTNESPTKLINNVTLKTEKGTTQIDHILISPYGIFVVETKNYSGEIYGASDDYTWTQKLGHIKSKFYNPRKQNARHIEELSICTSLPESSFINIVVFIKDNVATSRKLPNTVTHLKKLPELINNYSSAIIAIDEINSIASTIESKRLKPGLITDLRHTWGLRLFKIRRRLKLI